MPSIQKLGICKDAFDIEGRGTILGFHLYVPEGAVTHYQTTSVTFCKKGGELGTYGAKYGIILGGKKHRYDMCPVSLILEENNLKNLAIGSMVYVHDDLEFWQPCEETDA